MTIHFTGEMPICGDKDAHTLFKQCMHILCASLPENDGFCHLINTNINACDADGITVDVDLEGLCDRDDVGRFTYEIVLMSSY